MAVMEIVLPELGEGIDHAEVVAILVFEGDRVRKDQPLIEVESEKASVEIPSPGDGIIKEIRVNKGDSIRIGQTILILETQEKAEDSGGEKPSEDRGGKPIAPEPRGPEGAGRTHEQWQKAEAAGGISAEGRDWVEIATPDTGIRQAEPEEDQAAEQRAGRERAGRDPDPAPAPSTARTATVGKAAPAKERGDPEPVPAGPSERRLARELGIDIRDIRGSGPGGRIFIEDVKQHVRRVIAGKADGRVTEPAAGEGGPQPEAGLSRVGPPDQPALPDFSKLGEVRREPMGSLRRSAARTTGISWSLIPHVTQFDHADITELERHRKALSKEVEESGGKLTLTAIVIKVAALALRRFERFNASLDAAAEEIIYKKYVHIGVAVDTERGLVVPVVRAADRKSLRQIAAELTDLADRARQRKLSPDEMSGANFSVTNLGGLGTTYFTPIVTWPHVSVLGVGRAETHAVYQDGQFGPRLILPLSISYDHRLIDGADASRFLRWIAEALERPLKLLLES